MATSHLKNTVPGELTDELMEFCVSISAEQPRFVPSRPQFGAKASTCFDNVARHVAREDGRLVCGWAVWHLPGYYFEAEHHGVWEKPSRELVDVSPQINRSRSILFLPDPTSPYDPTNFRSNILQPERGSDLGERIVNLANRRNEILDSYRAGGRTGAEISVADAIELELVESQLASLGSLVGGQ